MNAHIENLGRRIELVPLDPHHHDITIALYQQPQDRGPSPFVVHTYSHVDGARKRIDFIAQAMSVLGGMERVPGGLRFPCGHDHIPACKRIFLEACKLETGTALDPAQASVHDKKSDSTMSARNLGGGAYRIVADRDDDICRRRTRATAAGLAKLAGLESPGDTDQVSFACGQDHDTLVGLLLPRAINVRAAMRDEAQKAARGVLAAPSGQDA